MNEHELMERLRQAFQGEARERLDSLTARLSDLENQDDPSVRKDSLEVAYREAHSLKGAARAVGFSHVEAVCQSAENVLSALKREEIAPSRDVVSGLYRALSFVEKAVQGKEAEESVASVCRRLESLLQTAQGANDCAPKHTLIGLFSEDSPVSTPVALSPEWDANGASCEPSHDPPCPGAEDAPTIGPRSVQNETALQRKTEDEPTDAVSTPVRFPKAGLGRGKEAALKSPSSVRVDVHRLEVFLKRAEELISAKLAVAQHVHDLKTLRRRFAQMRGSYSADTKEIKWLKECSARSARGEAGVPVDKLAELWRFIDTNRSMFQALYGDVSRVVAAAEENARYLATLVDELMEGAKEVLLQPFSTVLLGFSRMVRDLGDHLGKDVKLVIQGDDVEADRRILEELRDPLVHLLRNAVDHGLEPPAVRVKNGKRPEGTVWIRVEQHDARTVRVVVEDDGAGIDPDRLRQEAVRRGLLGQKEANELTDPAALELIFRSDLSTSSMVTELSGRGLGMAIVKDKVEGLGGRLRVDTGRGRGTRIVMELPVSLATFRGILIGEAGRLFVLPTHTVDAVVRVPHEDRRCVKGRETITFRDLVVPLERLGSVLGLERTEPQGPRQSDRSGTAVLLKVGDGHAAVEVDAVLGEQEVLIKGLGPQLQKVPHIWGATVLGSGQVVPVLNAADVVRSVRRFAEKSRAGANPKDGGPKTRKRPRSVLVAEDSVTSRTLLKNILEGAGYAVRTAVDGQEALSRLREEPVEAVVSDVEMPRMNGFDLTRAIRQDEKLKHVPVILVTSLDSREDR
ncbi:hybrid sensor histidine kinase/response regulator [Desulfosoma sp.]